MSDLDKVSKVASLDEAKPGGDGLRPGDVRSAENAAESLAEETNLPPVDDLAHDLAQDAGVDLAEMARATDASMAMFSAEPFTVPTNETGTGRESIGIAFDEAEAARASREGLGYHDAVDYEHSWSLEDFDGVGDPAGAAECWQLQTGNSCAVMSQAGVIEYVTGERLTEAEATAIAEENGWYDPATGTLPMDCARLLEHEGIPCEIGYDHTFEEIVKAIQNGEQVIVGVDANAIWFPIRDPETGDVLPPPPGGGHAVWITGVDVDPEGNWTVVMNDTGHPDGRARGVALEDFLQGWDSMGNLTVITDHGPFDTGGMPPGGEVEGPGERLPLIDDGLEEA